MLIVEFDAEHRAGQDGGDDPFDFNVFFFAGSFHVGRDGRKF